MKMTKRGDYERTVTFNAWSGYKVHIVFTEDLGRSRKIRYGSIGASEGAGAMHSAAEGGHSHLFFKIGDCPTKFIAHESWHAIFHMMVEWAGVKDLDNETVAYHLGYLAQQVADFRRDLIQAGVTAISGVKSSSGKQETNGNKDTQGKLAEVQDVPTYRGGVGAPQGGTAGEGASPQADGCGDIGVGYPPTGCC